LRYVEVYVKNALVKSGLEGTDYALNPYKGCEHRCVYCYSPYVLHMPMEEWNRVVYIKRNLPTVLDKELKKKRGMISIGTVTDAYQPAEKKYEITRKSLEVLRKHKRRVSILTKSSLVLRDADIIGSIPYAEIGVTITTLHEDWRKKIEPHASPVDERMQVLEELRDKAITYAFIGPIFEDLIMDELSQLLRNLMNMGVDYVIFDRFRYKSGMLFPSYLQEIVSKTDYYDIKRRIMHILKDIGMRAYFEW